MTLDDRELRDPRARAHAHLFLAASRYALHAVGGGADGALLEAARRDVLACRRADPSLSPLPRAFSPAFRAFFESTVAEAEAEGQEAAAEAEGGSGRPGQAEPASSSGQG